MAFAADPSVYSAIWNSKFQKKTKIAYVGDDLITARALRGTKGTILGLRNGIPDNAEQDLVHQRELGLRPYVKGMNPYTTNLMVDLLPSYYYTNPIAGLGGYEPNLASFNGQKPLATALDEPSELIQRLYEDKFRMSASNPLSAAYSMNQKRLDNAVRGPMYDAMRSRMKDNITDDDIVTESKINKGYGLDKNYKELDSKSQKFTNEVVDYMKKQRPINATDLTNAQQFEDLFNKHLNPDTFKDLGNQLQAANSSLTSLNTNSKQMRTENQNAYLWNKQAATSFRKETNAANIGFQASLDALNDAMLNNNTASTFGASRSDSAPMRAFLQQSPTGQSDATTVAPDWLETVRSRKQDLKYIPGESMTDRFKRLGGTPPSQQTQAAKKPGETFDEYKKRTTPHKKHKDA